MAGGPNARRFTDEDKARILTVLAANGGNVKRTARECDVLPATIRRWREQDAHGQGPPAEKIAAAVDSFAADAERLRNTALEKLEALVNSGAVSARELITTIGVLDDKLRLAKGLPNSKVEHKHSLPTGEELATFQAAALDFVQAGIKAAQERHDVIVDAELVEEDAADRPGLPAPTAEHGE